MNLFWDTCTFIAFLNGESANCDLPSLQRFVRDAKEGKSQIFASSLTIAEILPSYLVEKDFKAFGEFVADMQRSVQLITPSQPILELSARLRDIDYKKTSNKKDPPATRRLDVPDAIILATAIVLRDGYKQPIDAFHTFDNGGKRAMDGSGRCVPLLTLDTWCSHLAGAARKLAQRALELPRKLPVHDSPDLPGV